jgi:hypothetical protein
MRANDADSSLVVGSQGVVETKPPEVSCSSPLASHLTATVLTMLHCTEHGGQEVGTVSREVSTNLDRSVIIAMHQESSTIHSRLELIPYYRCLVHSDLILNNKGIQKKVQRSLSFANDDCTMSSTEEKKTFATITPALHPLLLRSLASLQFPTPTPIQSTLIPLALSSSRDILARARTGSGKTLSYAIPIVQGILTRRANGEVGGTRALILVPTRELAEQVRGQVGKLVAGLGLGEGEGEGVRVVNVAGNEGGRKKRKSGAGGERVER